MPQALNDSKTLRSILNKAYVPEKYPNHQLYYSNPIHYDFNSSAEYVYSFHIIEPRNFFLKWTYDKYYGDVEYLNVAVPWQIFKSTFGKNINNKNYNYRGTTFLAFSHNNILDVPDFHRTIVRKENFFMAYLPNISSSGQPCVGDNVVMFWDSDIVFRDKREGFFHNFHDNLFEPSLEFAESFFSGVSNDDYSNFEFSPDENPSCYDDYDDDVSYREPGDWFDTNWTVDQVTSQSFLKNKQSRRFLDIQDYWNLCVIGDRSWDAIYSNSK